MNYSSATPARWRWAFFFILISILPVLLLGQSALAQTFLPVDQAFRLNVAVSGPRAVLVDFRLAPGVYLYREQMKLQWQAAGGEPVTLAWDLPPGQSKHDPNFDRVLEVYHADVGGGATLPDGV